jgi:two-component system OmpR family sensor kinase
LSAYEKKSLFKFLGLYLGSAFVFITVIAALLYSTKIENLAELQRQKLKNYTSALSAEIIDSHMKGTELKIPKSYEFKIALIDKDGKVIHNELAAIPPLDKEFYESHRHIGIVDSSARLHHGIKYIIAEEILYAKQSKEAALNVIAMWLISMTLVCILAITLSKQFLKPVRQEVQRIDNFVKASTHELSTPITAIILSLDTLKRECKDAPPEISSKIDHLKTSAKMLGKIYEDLTYYLQRETLKKDEQWIDFFELAKERVSFYAKLAQSKNISVEAFGESFLYRIDTSAAERLVDNLLSNALKYSRTNGSVKITVKQNLISVEDDGIGMDAAQQKKIFDKFTRATDVGGGFGLGLYIVKTVCDDYKIKIEVQSEEGKGSKFNLLF